MPENIEYNMYLRRYQGKNTIVWFPKLQLIYVFC